MGRNRRQLADWLKTFQEVYSHTEAPEKFVFWSGVAAVSTALERKVVFDMKKFQLYANHYIILTGPPALKKTTAVNFALNLLQRIETINVGPSSITWQYLVDVLTRLNGVTPEELITYGKPHKDSAPMLLPASELGNLIDFQDRASIDFFNTAWDSPNRVDKGTRVMGDQEVYGPCIGIIAGTTPQWIKDNVRETQRGGGFISRCIMPFANQLRQLIAYPDELHDNHAVDLEAKLEHDLRAIHELQGTYQLSPEARHLGRRWYEQIYKLDLKTFGDDSDNWAQRQYSHVHKLAMVLAASRRDELIITDNDLIDAIERIKEIHKDFDKVFALMSERKETKAVKDLEAYFRENRQIELQALLTQWRTKYTKRELTEALDMLHMAGLVEKASTPTMVNGGIVVKQMLVYTGV